MRFALAWAACLAGAVHGAQRYGAVESNALVPRYFLDRLSPLAKRAADCAEGTHSCEDTENGDVCCRNDTYCFVNKDGEPGCCPIGSNCISNSECNSEHYFCTVTTSNSGSRPTTTTGCCPRQCPGTSNYLCPSDLGGGCCPYAARCQAGQDCIFTADPSSSTLTPVAEGCGTSQYRCDDGEGCCSNGWTCTQVTGAGFCAKGAPTDAPDDPSSSSGGELSDGAKVGIGVGTVVGVGLIIGIITWLCIHKRRDRRRTLTEPSGGGGGDRRHRGAGGDGSGSGAGGSRRVDDPTGMTDITASSRPQGMGLTQDYFGPHPVAGPFTETAASPGSTPGPHRAVPPRPEQPGDIAAPVEMETVSNTGDAGGRMSPSSQPSYLSSPGMTTNTIDGRFELHDTEMASPLPPDRSPSIVATPAGYAAPRDDMRI